MNYFYAGLAALLAASAANMALAYANKLKVETDLDRQRFYLFVQESKPK